MSPDSPPSPMGSASSSVIRHSVPAVRLHTEKPSENQVGSSRGVLSALPGVGDRTASKAGRSPALMELPLRSKVPIPSSSLLPAPSIPKPNAQDSFFLILIVIKMVYANYRKLENTDKQK